ncbi:hypothetical protein PG994_012212 [Apiospora phragmitis]|uniref:YTH domain-containing protein n=1 Tax=Apiospora phragmitis TaxID=2905665 RepID=A0ABR1TVD9_9PEZI
MGDAPPNASSTNDLTHPEALGGTFDDQGNSTGSHVGLSVFQPQQQFDPSHNAFSAQLDMTQPQVNGRAGPYNMGAMANALPQTSYRPTYTQGAQPRYNTGGPPPGIAHSMPQMAQYGGHTAVNPMMGQQYYMPPHPQVQQFYGHQLAPSQQAANMSPRHNMAYYPNQIMMNPAQQQLPGGYYYGQPGTYAGQNQAVPGQMMPGQFIPSAPCGASPSGAQDQFGSMPALGPADEASRNRSNVVRGPPRKPRQSGNAIWIGNLPPQTELMSLVYHVCQEASGLESLFLISKSNCAFANFKDEQSCVTAQQKLHDSKFQSVRLVSRLRKSTVEGTAGQTAPTGPAATSPHVQVAPVEAPEDQPEANNVSHATPEKGPEEHREVPAVDGVTQKDKFFILKSLTVEDLELSVRNGVWATQSHNEEALNDAYKSVDNVYLVFSANKSGEYFGYAKMTSPINNDPAAAIEFAPKAQTATDSDLPKAIPTEATEHCPRGNIIDDSARGTIFWEIERDDADTPETESEADDSASGHDGQDGEGGSKAWGKPFKLEWLSSSRLPFYRTRGLRNPWNSNREVKIARDGTELEPSVGRRLIGLFNRVQSPAPMAMGMRQGMSGYPPRCELHFPNNGSRTAARSRTQ